MNEIIEGKCDDKNSPVAEEYNFQLFVDRSSNKTQDQ